MIIDVGWIQLALPSNAIGALLQLDGRVFLVLEASIRAAYVEVCNVKAVRYRTCLRIMSSAAHPVSPLGTLR